MLKSASIYKNISEKAENEKTEHFGIKGISPLSRLLIIPDQVPYDYMHLVLQGHCKWMLQKFFVTKSSPAFIKDVVLLQKALLQIKVPHFFNRKPRSLAEINKWKSSEIKLFCFYLAIPLLMSYLPSIYFCHFACYVMAVRMLYEPINRNNLATVKEIINNYVKYLGVYYGDYAYDFTIHAHLHLVKQVEEHGPLKSHSQFVFEVMNLL
jgi:hypothetical protein